MLHYIVAFTLRDGVVEADALARVGDFLADLQARDHIAGYRLLRRTDTPTGAHGRYKADILFRDGTQFGLPFGEVRALGIHAGLHGLMIEPVEEMSVEVLQEIDRL
jgi:hypothetical protein